jgi:cytochrome c peroxidase
LGVIEGRFGPRNAPTLLYARYVPPLHFDPSSQRWTGGLFWDGRADSLEAQAAGPLLNPLEMNNPDKAAVVANIRNGPYADLFRRVFGAGSLDDDDTAFAALGAALAAYERSDELAPFASKYDRYLAGRTSLSAAEQRGLAIFEDPARGNCATCHPNRPAADGTPPLFTDFSYANLGIPQYANNLFLAQAPQFNPQGVSYIDHGLQAIVHDPKLDGMFRVPTLRNVHRTLPFGHSGYFANLPYIVDFISSRDVGSPDAPSCTRGPGAATALCAWPAAEVPTTLDHRVGSRPLTRGEIADLVAFLATLDDPPQH